MSTPGPVLGPPAPIPRGQNALNSFLTVMARDVPRELKKAATYRAALRRRAR